jgi:hypothetical protein
VRVRFCPLLVAAALVAALLPGVARAQAAPDAAPFVPSYDDWGDYGLLQTPGARTGNDGDLAFTYSHVHPYDRYNLFVTPLPWLEAGFRYTAIANRPYGPGITNQSYKDKSIDLKIRLAPESADFPETAVGFRDIAGTGLFSGEYIVFSRRYYDFDFSGGMGWGYLASRSAFANPLGVFSHSFRVRPASTGTGNFTLDYFRGPYVGLFGGVEYHTPIEGVTLKLELDPSDYQHEPLQNSFTVRSPVNAGVVYQPFSFMQLSAGFERGTTLMLRATIRANFNSIGLFHDSSKPSPLTPRPIEPPLVGRPLDETDLPRVAVEPAQPRPDAALVTPSVLRSPPPVATEAEPAVAARIFAALKKIGFTGESFAMNGNHAWLGMSQGKYHIVTIAIGRAARIVAAEAPPGIELITVDLIENNLTAASITLQRRDLENAVADKGSPEEIFMHTDLAGSDPGRPPAIVNSDAYPWYEWGLNPRIRQQIGGPDNFLIYQIYAELAGTAHLAPGLSLDGALGANLFNNLNELTPQPVSVLPHVRSDIGFYLKQGKTGIFQGQGDYLFNIAPDWYGRASAGLLEYMYAGVDSEVLYRPYGLRFAVGLDVNHVIKRDFNDLFGLQNYQVTEGLLSLYYKLPFYNLTAVLRVGRYLAGDKGATIELSRQFESGVRAGIFATKTNVSTSEFGEGSFDKGFFISFPLDLLLSNPSRSEASYIYRPLTRDGGQYLDIAKPLYPLVDGYDPEELSHQWPHMLQ